MALTKPPLACLPCGAFNANLAGFRRQEFRCRIEHTVATQWEVELIFGFTDAVFLPVTLFIQCTIGALLTLLTRLKLIISADIFFFAPAQR
ncbi:hypothetical protein A3C37_02565 [Candidatus Peribacteria bacterium RIFCSPHIGHO2_02_FULL_53_20]|nr:MAG: hypothetical protein A3C37_02565 [Candidatus Peribacteria bacterium RIFCSPHIGHO2_02_FULL_53_20]OGJ67790.1 MAG: hypothetical protein A3B61_03445 [Candidatus Peribacteria bacterium RIFCSPLOWO2_01_FULL_53_10]OGJ69517.1 MAG: hypothetical protein A3G69_02240 [Candidatus Peribacteria bacterium RIFCSPLOWO2_12_FULL_53_10]